MFKLRLIFPCSLTVWLICLDNLSILISGMLKSPTIIVLYTNSPFRCVLMALYILILPCGAHILKSYVFLMNYPLIIIWCSFLYLFTFFWLEVYFVWYEYGVWLHLLSFFFFFLYFVFLGLHLWHMEVPRLGVQSKLQLQAYATATVTPDLSPIWKLHHSSRQCQILNPQSEARDQTGNLMFLSQIHFHCIRMGPPRPTFFWLKFSLCIIFHPFT